MRQIPLDRCITLVCSFILVWKEQNILFNDELNLFVFGYMMVKNHSGNKKGSC